MSEKIKLTDEELLRKLKERHEKARLAVKKKEEAIKEKERKNRDRSITEAGKLVEDFGLLNLNHDFRILAWILGEAVIVIQENQENASKVAQWEEIGEYLLSFSSMERKEKALNRKRIIGGSEN